MNAPPFPIAPDVGEMFQNWVWNGARWVATPTTGLRVLTRTFTASGPYMPSPGLVSCAVECIGGGGAGGGVGNPLSLSGYVLAGGGGGSGGYSRKTVPATLVRGGVLVTIGDGGSGTGAASGGTGGTTNFGALCVANGGGGGQACDGQTTVGAGGEGASPGLGDVAFPGAHGMNGPFMAIPSGAALTAAGGIGGAVFGGNTVGDAGSGSGQPGPDGLDNTGAGGAGAVLNAVVAFEGAGGAGGSGVCIVTEYCWGDRDQPLNEWSPPMNVNLNVRPPKPWPPGQPGPWWPPGWPPGWGPNPPWPPGWQPWPRGALPQGQEFEAGAEPFGQGEEPEDP